jgi:hypothetical protein
VGLGFFGICKNKVHHPHTAHAHIEKANDLEGAGDGWVRVCGHRGVQRGAWA